MTNPNPIAPTKRKMPDLNLSNGETPRQRGIRKEQDVCLWVYLNGASTADLINQVAGQQAPGYAKRMVDKGLLIATRTISGSPKYFYTLSRVGLDLATSLVQKPIQYKGLEPYKLSQTIFAHNFCVQRLSLEARQHFGFKYQSQAQIALEHKAGIKIPDAVWLDKNGKRIAVEVEFSQKFGRNLDQTIAAIIKSMEDEEYCCYFYFVRSNVIATNYTLAMSPGAVFDHWTKNSRGAWIFSEIDRQTVPKWLIERVFFMDANEPFEDPRPLDFGL